MTPAISVVGAAIRRGDRLLVAQRPVGKHEALLWEFPGGKIEPGESPAEALVREIREELGVAITVGELLGEVWHPYPGRTIHLAVYWARLVSGEPEPREAAALRWLAHGEFDQVVFAPADVPLVDRLLARPGFGGEIP